MKFTDAENSAVNTHKGKYLYDMCLCACISVYLSLYVCLWDGRTHGEGVLMEERIRRCRPVDKTSPCNTCPIDVGLTSIGFSANRCQCTGLCRSNTVPQSVAAAAAATLASLGKAEWAQSPAAATKAATTTAAESTFEISRWIGCCRQDIGWTDWSTVPFYRHITSTLYVASHQMLWKPSIILLKRARTCIYTLWTPVGPQCARRAAHRRCCTRSRTCRVLHLQTVVTLSLVCTT